MRAISKSTSDVIQFTNHEHFFNMLLHVTTGTLFSYNMPNFDRLRSELS